MRAAEPARLTEEKTVSRREKREETLLQIVSVQTFTARQHETAKAA